MKRSFVPIPAAIALVAALVPASASASTLELGATKSQLVSPSCPPSVTPQNCTIILTRTTALETLRDSVRYPTTVKQAGYIVAFTLGLSKLANSRKSAKADIHFLDQSYGGTTKAAITVLRPSGKFRQHAWTVVAESPLFRLQPYLGQVVQFPLSSGELPVAPGDVVALTVPTWAPVLSFNLPTSKFSYRQSRLFNCTHPPGQLTAQLRIGVTTRYMCDYTGTRVEYSATEVTTPVAAKNAIH